MDQADVYTLKVRFAEPRGAEMTRKELYKPEMRGNEVVNLLLVLGKGFFVRSSKLLFAVERIWVPSEC